MKRTNLVLDEQLLDRAKAVSGLPTYSQVVNEALSEFIRLKTFATIDQYASSGVWEGDLAVMREDHDETR
ncbi:MAG: type II toxin-antitoxin system VapB family antitoxin [Spirochaetaceae bacterium]